MTVSVSIRYVTDDGRLTQAGYTLLEGIETAQRLASDVAAPSGGGVVDVEARAAIAAILTALGAG